MDIAWCNRTLKKTFFVDWNCKQSLLALVYPLRPFKMLVVHRLRQDLVLFSALDQVRCSTAHLDGIHTNSSFFHYQDLLN